MTIRHDELAGLLGTAEVMRRRGRVVEIRGGGRYLLEDELGRRFVAEGGERWALGQAVAVIGRRIVGAAPAFGRAKHFTL